MSRSCLVLIGSVVLVALAGAGAHAEPDPVTASVPGPGGERLIAGERLFRPPIEWSTWVRGAYGLASSRVLADAAARSISPEVPEDLRHSVWELGVGIEASLPISTHGNTRIGAWAEARGLGANDTFVGGELVLTQLPAKLDLFLYEGSGIWMVRAGRSRDRETVALAFGYLAPWKLEGPCAVRFFGIETGVCQPRPARATRYMVGVRLVATATRATEDARDWSLTFGIETELAGALRTLGFRSWY